MNEAIKTQLEVIDKPAPYRQTGRLRHWVARFRLSRESEKLKQDKLKLPTAYHAELSGDEFTVLEASAITSYSAGHIRSLCLNNILDARRMNPAIPNSPWLIKRKSILDYAQIHGRG